MTSPRKRNWRKLGQRPRNPLPYDALYKTQEWRKRRAKQLADHPCCAFHLKRGERVKAVIADHIQPHRGDRNAFFRGALQSLCVRCHDSVKKARERGNRAGCDAHGMPIDENHPWGVG